LDWFAAHLLAWFDLNGRKDLPWQSSPTPYRVWVSEIMLQQTQVTTVIPYYERFMARFPTVEALAAAELDEVLHHWTGLGYYARGRNLHKTAQILTAEHHGIFPTEVDELVKLPGIGRSTAGAIVAISTGVRAPILDGNVKRVLARYHGISGYPGSTATAKALWQQADKHTPAERVADYTQAIMDLGATVCSRRPACDTCPVNARCVAHATNSVTDYPGKKPRKAKPTRSVRMFLIQNAAGDCLLEQRPANGIWGGLWTPPERSMQHTSTEMLAELGESANAAVTTRTAPPLRHTFTHFHMDIEAVHIVLRHSPIVVAEGKDWLWYGQGNNTPIGLSAPAVKLIQGLKS
jgi:A/G-specific adenine glycosylase